MKPAELHYPMDLDAAAIRAVLPHRGEILFVEHVLVLSSTHYVGQARWARDLPLLQGHFPGMPVVPGVLLVEAAAQVAGAGMLHGDPDAQRMGLDHIGLLAGIRKCSFKHPVLPEQAVRIDIQARRMSEFAVMVSGLLEAGGLEAATVEILVVNTPRDRLLEHVRAAVKSAAISPSP